MGVPFFSLSSELALPPKPIELDADRTPWKWVRCDCNVTSPCSSESRCHALEMQWRISSVPSTLRMPDVAGVRAMVRWIGTNEPFMVDAIMAILASACVTADALFIDSGMNEGMWTVLGAFSKCRTVGIEPQPQCLPPARMALDYNELTARTINALLAPIPTTATIDTSKPCFGGFQPNEAHSVQGKSRHAQVGSLRLDELDELKNPNVHIALWHLDVEGAEIPVLRSAAKLFANRRIDRVLFEITLKRWGQFGISSKKEGLDELRRLFSGWTCTWACNGRAFPWAPVPRHQVYCGRPWNVHSDLGWGLFDVFCVAPGVDPLWNATGTMIF